MIGTAGIEPIPRTLNDSARHSQEQLQEPSEAKVPVPDASTTSP